MLEPQKSELPHETEYFLDGAVEFLDIDYGTRMVLIVFGDRAKIEAIIDGFDQRLDNPVATDLVVARGRFARFRMARLAKCDRLTEYADELLAELSPVYRVGAHITAVNGLLSSLSSHASCYAEWAIGDAYEGGYMANYNRRPTTWRQLENRSTRGTKRKSRMLTSPAFIKRYVEAREESPRLRALWHTLLRRGVPTYSEADLEKAMSVFDAAYEAYRDRLEEAERRAMQAFVAGVHSGGAERVGATSKRPKSMRIIERRKRKVIKRSALLAAGLIGASAVSAFASGKPVLVDGKEMAFEVSRRGSIARSGHSAIELTLLDKKRTRLAELCLYIEGTPAIDQLVGVALAVRAGEEREVLATANVVKVEAPGVGHELLTSRPQGELQEDEPIPVLGRPVVRAAWRNGTIIPADRPSNLDLQKARNAAYFAETKEAWVNALGTYVFNREWKNVKGMLPA